MLACCSPAYSGAPPRSAFKPLRELLGAGTHDATQAEGAQRVRSLDDVLLPGLPPPSQQQQQRGLHQAGMGGLGLQQTLLHQQLLLHAQQQQQEQHGQAQLLGQPLATGSPGSDNGLQSYLAPPVQLHQLQQLRQSPGAQQQRGVSSAPSNMVAHFHAQVRAHTQQLAPGSGGAAPLQQGQSRLQLSALHNLPHMQ